MNKRWLLALTLLGAVLAAPASLWSSTQVTDAAFVGQDIASAGPLTHIYVGTNMSCQVAHTGDAVFEMYSPSNQQGACGTVVFIDGASYGNFASNNLTPVSQTAVTGSGTSGSPFQVVTVADAGATGIRVTETVKYVVGDEFYRTDTVVQNNGNAQVSIKIYTYADCYLGGSDSGFGFLDAIGGVVACTENANNSPAGRIEEWTPITPPDHFFQGPYGQAEGMPFAGTDLPDTCVCLTSIDNGAALQWNRSLNAGGGSTTVSHFKTFSPLGVGAPTATPSGETATPPPTEEATQVRLKTHTPTSTATASPTGTPTPVTPTNTATASAMMEPTGGRAGVITGPNTGGGPAGGSSRSTLLFGAAMLAVAGAFATAIGRKVRR
jgi:hypothetical protein